MKKEISEQDLIPGNHYFDTAHKKAVELIFIEKSEGKTLFKAADPKNEDMYTVDDYGRIGFVGDGNEIWYEL